MKIYVSEVNESWVVDRFREEWITYNQDLTVERIKDSDIVWIISPWVWRKISKRNLKSKKVLCTIHHLEEKDFTNKNINEFKKRDAFVDKYHVISKKTKDQLEKLTDKEITYIPFWINQNIWYEIESKKELRRKYKLNTERFIVGSFQRDTEGNDLVSPKLIKGPDRFLKIIKALKKDKENLTVLLTGKRRNYLINEFKKADIDFQYFEMANFSEMNELYNCLDLYIVSSRIEGGPQAIVECGLTKTPIISTDVGIAKEILASESIFNMNNFLSAKPNVEHAFQNSKELTIPVGFEGFKIMFKSFYEKI